MSVTIGHGPAVDGGVVFGGDGVATVVWMRLEVAWCSGDRDGGSPELESGISTSFLKFPAIKQLAIERWDEHGFLIHPVLAPSQSALFLTSYFSPFIIPKDFYTNLVDISG
nr:hypothetical protein [Tanacetum cinerariifolium]